VDIQQTEVEMWMMSEKNRKKVYSAIRSHIVSSGQAKSARNWNIHVVRGAFAPKLLGDPPRWEDKDGRRLTAREARGIRGSTYVPSSRRIAVGYRWVFTWIKESAT